MDLFREIADMINPVKNAQILNEIEQDLKTKRLFTMKLGEREYQTTNSREAFLFSHSFGKRAGFSMSSKPYAGAEINSVVNTKQ